MLSSSLPGEAPVRRGSSRGRSAREGRARWTRKNTSSSRFPSLSRASTPRRVCFAFPNIRSTANTPRVARRRSSAADSTSLIPHLLQFTDEHRTEAASLQTELQAFAAELSEALEEIWKKAPEAEEGGEGAGPAPDSWAARMEAHEKRRHASPVDTIAKPDLSKQEWTLKLLDVRPGL